MIPAGIPREAFLVRDYYGLYLTEDGRLFSYVRRRGSSEPTARPLKWTPDRKGYLYATSMQDGQRKRIYLHRALCEHFHGPAPAGRPMARHLNDVREDNRRENLAWGSGKENADDRTRNGGMDATRARGNKIHTAVLDAGKVRDIRQMYGELGSFERVASLFGVDSKTVRNIVHRRTWKHVS